MGRFIALGLLLVSGCRMSTPVCTETAVACSGTDEPACVLDGADEMCLAAGATQASCDTEGNVICPRGSRAVCLTLDDSCP